MPKSVLQSWITLYLSLLISLLSACSNNVPTVDKPALPESLLVQKPAQKPVYNFIIPNFETLPLSQGDRVRIKVDEGEIFSGVFEINLDGCLHIPYLAPIKVTGLSIKQAEQKLTQVLIAKKMFQPGFKGVSITILQWSKIQIYVTGAVFKPGRVMINDQLVAEQSFQQTQESGDYSVNRYLSAALKGAGGIRPDANLAKIELMRDNNRLEIDVSGIFTGQMVADIPLIAGDKINVPSVGYLQNHLVRPSQITPPGFQIFMSNLSEPISGNAQAAVSKASRDTPYGTHLLEGAISANCVGGSWINSSRKILHSSKDIITGQLKVNLFDLDDIIANINNEAENPYLMPDDGIACFDSNATNVHAVIQYINDILIPSTAKSLLLP